MTNKDMVKQVDPQRAKSPGADTAREERARTEPREGPREGLAGGEQFPPDPDPADSPQLEPMINARRNAGLKKG